MISIRINIVENTYTDFNLLSLPNKKTPNIEVNPENGTLIKTPKPLVP